MHRQLGPALSSCLIKCCTKRLIIKLSLSLNTGRGRSVPDAVRTISDDGYPEQSFAELNHIRFCRIGRHVVRNVGSEPLRIIFRTENSGFDRISYNCLHMRPPGQYLVGTAIES